MVARKVIEIGAGGVTHASRSRKPPLDSLVLGKPPLVVAMSLYSNHGALCCDGSEAVHLSNVEWTAPDSSSHHYRVKIPVNANAYARARHSEEVETMWVEVPDDAVVDEPNKEGTALVWPTYGPPFGAAVRCFMPGAEG